MSWKTIETAPRDGTPIIACSYGPWPDSWSAGLHPTTVRFREYHVNRPGKKAWRDQDGKPVAPTHWMSIPKAPSENPKVEIWDEIIDEPKKPTQILKRGDKVRVLIGFDKGRTGYISNSLDPFRHYVKPDGGEDFFGYFKECDLEKTGGRVKLTPLKRIKLG